MALDKTLLCKTTAWHFNCGLNCLSHFLYDKLESGELQRTFSSHPAYNELLNTFSQYYQLSSQPTWDEVYQLLSAYRNATDREAIFAPVLRQHLGKVLLKHTGAVWDSEAAAAISDYLKTGEAHDMAEPLVHPNLEYLKTLKAEYDRGVSTVKSQKSNEQEIALAKKQLAGAIPPREATEKSVRDQIIFQRNNDLEDALNQEAQIYWINKGMQRYANHIADLNQSVMVSADQLTLLGQELDIGTEFYIEDSLEAKSLSNGHFHWRIKVHNSEAHWQYEEPSQNPEKVAEHNQYYDTPSLGEFKIYGPKEDSQEELISAYIRSQWEQLKTPTPNEVPTPHEVTMAAPKPITTGPTTVSKPTLTSPIPYLPPKESLKQTPPLTGVLKFGQHLFSGLKNYIENKQTQLIEFRYKKLHQNGDMAMDQLLNKLQNAVRKGTINDIEKQVIFEFYFNAIEEELTKGPAKQLNQRRLESIIKEVKRSDVVSMRRFVLEEGKTNYDIRRERKRELPHDTDPSPAKKRRM
jgi:hypothetical protein